MNDTRSKMPHRLRRTLEKSGWFPGRNVEVDGSASQFNPFDPHAVQIAVEILEEFSDLQVSRDSCLCVGEPSHLGSLRECLTTIIGPYCPFGMTIYGAGKEFVVNKDRRFFVVDFDDWAPPISWRQRLASYFGGPNPSATKSLEPGFCRVRSIGNELTLALMWITGLSRKHGVELARFPVSTNSDGDHYVEPDTVVDWLTTPETTR